MCLWPRSRSTGAGNREYSDWRWLERSLIRDIFADELPSLLRYIEWIDEGQLHTADAGQLCCASSQGFGDFATDLDYQPGVQECDTGGPCLRGCGVLPRRRRPRFREETSVKK